MNKRQIEFTDGLGDNFKCSIGVFIDANIDGITVDEIKSIIDLEIDEKCIVSTGQGWGSVTRIA